MNKKLLAVVLMSLSMNVTAAGIALNWSGQVKSVATSPTNVEVKSGYIDYDLDQSHVRENLELNNPKSMEKDQLIVFESMVPMLSLAL